MDRRGIVCRREVLAQGMSVGELKHRLRPDGPWQRVLPGVYAAFTGPLTDEHYLVAALAYAGDGAMLTGHSVLRLLGVRYLPAGAQVHVLNPAHRQVSSRDFVRITRTHRPHPVDELGGFPVAPAARALSDWAATQRDLGVVRAVVASAVQLRRVSVRQLSDELAQCAVAGSRLLRRVLAEVGEGVRSAPEAQARLSIIRSRVLPEPLWNPRLFVHGSWLADPDGYWVDAGLASEIDSMEWHLGAREAKATALRRARMEAAGIRVISNPPSRWREDPGGAVRELEQAYLHGLRGGPPPGVTAVSRRASA